jgi:hypothetical protein
MDAPQTDLASLLAREAPLDIACRAGSADACAEREQVLSDLHDMGWCYGPPIREQRRKTWKLCSSWPKCRRAPTPTKVSHQRHRIGPSECGEVIRLSAPNNFVL